MGKIRYFLLFLLLLYSLALISCRSAATKTEGEGEKGTTGLSAEEQDKGALVLFQQVFDLLQDSDRKAAVPKMEALYREIITRYPKAALTQESYWRLVLIYLKDYDPPAYGKAEATYEEFISRYPQSQFRREVENDITNAYYRNGQWESLMKFCTPAVKRYIEKGKLDRPLDMFLYAEAKKNLGDTAEAVKGYKIVIALFPNSREGSMAKLRLAAIEKENKDKTIK
ncbi:MAG: tetratricopeptide repeat protein [Nitrospiraceae bacterium]|nr:tetratricopeptide repeat protein [Nitrospiraceae bacterium]